MLKQRNKNNLPSIPEAPDDSTIIATSYDGFYQTMTVTGEPGVEVQTLDKNNNVVGSGTIDETGSVTYPINEGMLAGGSQLVTKATSRESNVVSNNLVSSFYLASDIDGHNIDFNVRRDLYLGLLDDHGGNENLSNTLVGEMIVEYSTGQTHVVDLSNYRNQDFWIDENGVGSFNTAPSSKTGLVSAKVRFRNLNDQVYLWVAQGTHFYKFFDDGVSNIGYGLAERDSRPRAVIKQIPNYLPSSVVNMNCMFWDNKGDSYNEHIFENSTVESVLENWDVSNVKTMVASFASTSLYDLPISNWTPTSLEYAIGTFAYSNFNKTLNWITPNLLDTSFMFEGSLINSPINLTMGTVTNIAAMFSRANLFNQSIGHWDVSSVTNFSGVFAGATAFNQNINTWNVSNGTNFSTMFRSCSSYNQPLNNWNVSNVTTMDGMFRNCTNFNQNINTWNMISVTSISYMFNGATSFNQPLNNWNVSNIMYMVATFYRASSFNQNISNWCVSLITSEPNSFSSYSPLITSNKPIWGTCPSISGIPANEMHFTTVAGSVDYVGTQGDQILLSDGTIVDITATDQTFTFNAPAGRHIVKLVESAGRNNYVSVGGEALVELHNFPTLSTVTKFNFATYNYNNLPNLTKVPNFLPSNITNMIGMFTYASAFNQPLNNWNVSSVTDMGGMFYYASAFNQDLNNWNVSNVTNMTYMFVNASSFNQDLNNWDVSNVTNMDGMFGYASSFNQDLSSWCVSNFPTMPAEFDTGATNWTLPRPVWGTCPTP